MDTPVTITRHDSTVAYVISKKRIDVITETLELPANPEAMKALVRLRQENCGTHHSMKSNRIGVSPQAAEFIRSLAPEPGKQLREGLRKLSGGKSDILELEHPLDGFNRLRVARYRVIFHYHIKGRSKTIRCDYIERRELVYELFNDLIRGEQYSRTS